MGLIRQKSKRHEVIEQIGFQQFKEEMSAFCQKFCPFNVPFLHMVCCYVLSTRQKLVALKHTFYFIFLYVHKVFWLQMGMNDWILYIWVKYFISLWGWFVYSTNLLIVVNQSWVLFKPFHEFNKRDTDTTLSICWWSTYVFTYFVFLLILCMCNRLQKSLMIKNLQRQTTRQLDVLNKKNLGRPLLH